MQDHDTTSAPKKRRKSYPSKPKIARICEQCGAEFLIRAYRIDTARFCSNACYNASKRGKPGHSWQGGRTVGVLGYVVLTERGTRRVQYEHRAVMEQHLGRPLTKGEEVHHINKDKTDNRLENLRLMDTVSHRKLHAKGPGREHKWSRDYDCCQGCGTTVVRYHGHGLCHNCYNQRRTWQHVE